MGKVLVMEHPLIQHKIGIIRRWCASAVSETGDPEDSAGCSDGKISAGTGDQHYYIPGTRPGGYGIQKRTETPGICRAGTADGIRLSDAEICTPS